MRGIGLAIFIATVGALSNALFAYGQVRANVTGAPFAFVILVQACALCISLLIFPFIPGTNVLVVLTQNFMWAFLTGLGLISTLTCFYFLFSLFGASYYALYSVMALIVTIFLVGGVLLKESINIFHVGSTILAMGAVVLFTLGQARISA